MSTPQLEHTPEGGRRFWRVQLTLIGLFAAAVAALCAVTAFAVSTASNNAYQSERFRVVALKHVDGRVEFGLQHFNSSDDQEAWSGIVLPDSRFLEASAAAGVWRASSAVYLDIPNRIPPLLPSDPLDCIPPRGDFCIYAEEGGGGRGLVNLPAHTYLVSAWARDEGCRISISPEVLTRSSVAAVELATNRPTQHSWYVAQQYITTSDTPGDGQLPAYVLIDSAADCGAWMLVVERFVIEMVEPNDEQDD